MGEPAVLAQTDHLVGTVSSEWLAVERVGEDVTGTAGDSVSVNI